MDLLISPKQGKNAENLSVLIVIPETSHGICYLFYVVHVKILIPHSN